MENIYELIGNEIVLIVMNIQRDVLAKENKEPQE